MQLRKDAEIILEHSQTLYEHKDIIRRLLDELNKAEKRYRQMSADGEALYDLRRIVFKTGKDLEGNEHEEEDIIRIGKELVAESEICPACEGDGMDGDEDGGSYACERCQGEGINRAVVFGYT